MKTKKYSSHRVVRALALATGMLLVCMQSRADELKLKDGKTVQGKYLSGTDTTIKFETSAGVLEVEKSKVAGLTIGSGSSGSAAGAAPAAGAAAPAAATQVTIAAGTPLVVRTAEPVSSKDPAGKKFSGTLNTDLVAANGTVVAKAGTKVYGKVQSSTQAGRVAGQSTLDLRLTELVLGSTSVPLTTRG